MSNNRKKIVITGASGFLGSNLVKRLQDDTRFQVYALSSHPDEMAERLSASNIEFCDKDVICTAQAQKILENAIVISCAFPRNSTGTGMADGLHYIRKVFEAAIDHHAEAIINISSQSVYSPKRAEAATEETPVSLETPYAVGKYAVEQMLESLCRNTQTAFTSIRMASLIGPGFDQRIVNRFVKQALETGALTVKKNDQRFGFFDIEDAVTGLVNMLGSDISLWKPIYNLGGIGSFSLTEIAACVQAVLEQTDHIHVEISAVDGTESGSSELDARLFYHDFAFAPGMKLKDSTESIRYGMTEKLM